MPRLNSSTVEDAHSKTNFGSFGLVELNELNADAGPSDDGVMQFQFEFGSGQPATYYQLNADHPNGHPNARPAPGSQLIRPVAYVDLGPPDGLAPPSNYNDEAFKQGKV